MSPLRWDTCHLTVRAEPVEAPPASRHFDKLSANGGRVRHVAVAVGRLPRHRSG